jgi:protocatechuate 3,4-dioxygenase beta subunit
MNDLSTQGAIDPPYLYPDYRGTRLRAPREALLQVPRDLLDVAGPRVPEGFVRAGDIELTVHGKAAPMGEKMILTGRLLDESGGPIRRSLVEVWQANASGRYAHAGDQHDAPLDPNFPGVGRTFTDDDGWYRFMTIKPGAYPWPNHPFAWRPQHIHFSLLGNAPVQRLVRNVFPGDPCWRSIFNSVPERRAGACSHADGGGGIENAARLPVRHRVVGGQVTPLGI